MTESNVQQAVILAAGLGTRLLPLTADRPKALVEVAGTALLRRLLDSCEAAGLREAVVITGHRRGQLERWLQAYDGSLRLRTVHNEAYDTLGNAWSLYCARAAVGGDGFIKLDGDLLLDSSIVTRLRQRPGSAIVLDRSVTLDAEAMKAAVDRSGRVQQMGKWLPLTEAHGESIGVEKIAADDYERVFAGIRRRVKGQGEGDAYYEDVYHALIAAGWHLDSYDCSGAFWCEVDDSRDLARAEAALGQTP
ncbi:MAG TPA: phosphocholine cytidylyltransferase family protein [Sorangium sp.]|nr:phosphocholine cytidylyltransferase family protein [Sorangium sp.]